MWWLLGLIYLPVYIHFWRKILRLAFEQGGIEDHADLVFAMVGACIVAAIYPFFWMAWTLSEKGAQEINKLDIEKTVKTLAGESPEFRAKKRLERDAWIAQQEEELGIGRYYEIEEHIID